MSVALYAIFESAVSFVSVLSNLSVLNVASVIIVLSIATVRSIPICFNTVPHVPNTIMVHRFNH